MFDISVLKEMKLSELQDIAKFAKNIKTTGVKKDNLIALILEQQEKSEPIAFVNEAVASEEKTKRTRITPEKKPLLTKKNNVSLFPTFLASKPFYVRIRLC